MSLEDQLLRPLPTQVLDAGEAKVIAHIAAAAARMTAITRVILFGSRATRSHRPRSDFDIAVQADKMDHLEWAQFAQELQESVPTLCGLDLIKLDADTSPSLRDAILKTGLILYEK